MLYVHGCTVLACEFKKKIQLQKLETPSFPYTTLKKKYIYII